MLCTLYSSLFIFFRQYAIFAQTFDVIKKILIIRFSSIGDIVLTTPVIRCLKQQAAAEIHYLVKPGFAHVIETNPYIDRTILLKDDFNDTIRDLKQEKYDLIVDLHKNLRSYRISIALPVKTVRFNKLNFKKWLLVRFKWNLLQKDKHLINRYFDALKPFGIYDDGYGMDYPISPEDDNKAIEIAKGLPYQVLVLGATYFTKRIPEEKCAEIINSYPDTTILTGGSDVAELADRLTARYPGKILNTAGNVRLGVSAALIRHSQRVVTGDTGLMHIAAALQKEIIVIWGNTIPQFGMYPYYGHKSTQIHINKEVLNLQCRPCSKLGFDHCPKGHLKCMKEIEW